PTGLMSMTRGSDRNSRRYRRTAGVVGSSGEPRLMSSRPRTSGYSSRHEPSVDRGAGAGGGGGAEHGTDGARRAESVRGRRGAGRGWACGGGAGRDQPPFHRATRDGFAVRSADVAKVPRSLRRVGEVAAGAAATTAVAAGECVEIMTGAPLPAGADAVAMV